jgi:WD40 repeat protein
MVGKGHGNQINKLFVQGENLVSCAMDDTVRITPLATKQYSGSAIALDSTPADIAVTKKDLVVAVTTNQVVVIRGGNLANKHSVSYQPTSVAVSVDETQIAVGGKDNKIRLYSLNGDKLVDGPVLEGHRGALTTLSYSPDGKYLGSGDVQRDIFVWDLASKSVSFLFLLLLIFNTDQDSRMGIPHC